MFGSGKSVYHQGYEFNHLLCDLSLMYACSMMPSSVLLANILVHSSIRSAILDLTWGCVV